LALLPRVPAVSLRPAHATKHRNPTRSRPGDAIPLPARSIVQRTSPVCEHPPITHRLSTITRATTCVLPEECDATDCRARARYRGPTTPHRATSAFRAARRGPVGHLPRRPRLSTSHSIQARRSRPPTRPPGTTRDPRHLAAVVASPPETGSMTSFTQGGRCPYAPVTSEGQPSTVTGIAKSQCVMSLRRRSKPAPTGRPCALDTTPPEPAEVQL
jgi:hypothetical protein